MNTINAYRAITFRAKSPERNGGWVHGSLVHHGLETQIVATEATCNANGVTLFKASTLLVDDDTIGQATGFKDCNNTPIYEGDILQPLRTSCVSACKVVWDEYEGGFYCDFFTDGLYQGKSKPAGDYLHSLDDIAVVGNIYDNPNYTNPADDDEE